MGLKTPTSTPTLNTNKNTEPSYMCYSGEIHGEGCNNSIYEIEKDIIKNLNTFYSKYAEYVRCNSSPDNSADNSNFVDTLSDSTKTYGLNRTCSTSINYSSVETAYNAVIDSINRLNTAINSINGTANITLSSDTIDGIKQRYSNNLNLRNELDLKMKEILKTDDSFVNQSKLHYDSTMYASIGWTILATSLLYYVFRKL